ncbi:Transposon Tf2-12 polyprotein [Vitis vinifera]|uniref:Transposon Tf2-12 polyprotein n=1 Tax=Vitis vinifera TaxID=29760 RepID=A0A438DIX5_VITVI|nr:Transposon Tf2-12 polyprotein [Vitis vinifera]
MSLMTLYSPYEIDEHGTFAEVGDIVDGAAPHDEYIDEMLALSLSQIEETVQPGLASSFDLFGVSTIELAEESLTALAPEPTEDVIAGDVLFGSHVGVVEGASDFVDPPLLFDVLSGFVSRFDIVSDHSSMDFSTFEYLPVSRDIILSAPSSTTSQIFDIDGEIAQHDSDDDSSSASDSDPIDQRVSPAVGDTEIVDFGTTDQPRELRIGSDLSTDERDSLIQLLRSYLDVFAWSYEDMPGLDPSIIPASGESEAAQCKIYISGRVPRVAGHIVPVPKKDGKVRVCIDFRDLNKASPKDDFPLPHIDMLVDNTAGHSMLSFMDGFFGYSQILMALEDMEKTSFITEWGTYCYRVMPFGLKNLGATYQRAATTLFHDMMHWDVEVYVDDMIVKSRDRSDHLAALERFFERIRQFRLRLNPKKCTFEVTSGKLLGYMVSERGIEVDPDKIRAILDMPAPRTEREVRGFLGRLQYISRFIARLTDIFLAPPTPGRHLLLYLSVSDVALGCMLAQLDDSGKDRAIYYLSKRMLDYETRYVMIERYCLALKSIRGSIVADHIASLPVSDGRAIDDDFPDDDVTVVTSLSGWRMYFDGAANHSGYGIGILLISPHGDHIPRSVRLAFSDRHLATNNIVEYEACILGLETALGIRQMEVFGDSNLNQFVDALATLASMIDVPVDATVRPLLIESRSAPTYYCLIDDTETDDGLPWYHDIYHFLRLGVYPEVATAKDRRALRQLAARFVICGETLYRRSADEMLLLCLDRASADRVMRELIMETDCCQFVQRCPECQIHGDLIHVSSSELHALTSPWPFSVWGIDIIGKISPKSSSGHEFILVTIDYFTKWVEAASYARLTLSEVASFIISHIICRYGVPHELISDKGVHFRAEVDTLVQRYSIRHHRSSAYRPQTNGAHRTSFRTSTGATPYSLVYGMEAVLPVKIEMGSLRVASEQQIPKADWAQARFDQLNLLNERRLRAANHVIRGLIRDPRGKFRPNWSGPYFIRELSPEGAAWLMDLDGNRFSEPTNVDQLKSDPTQVRYFLHIIITHLIISSVCFICFLIDIMFTVDTYHPEAMRSDVVFDSLYLDRCLRSGCHLDIVMFLLLGDVFLMIPTGLHDHPQLQDAHRVDDLASFCHESLFDLLSGHFIRLTLFDVRRSGCDCLAIHDSSADGYIEITRVTLPFRWIESCGDTLYCGIFSPTIPLQFGIQSLRVFLVTTFRVVFLSLRFMVFLFSLAFRAIVHFPFGVQSHVFILAFRAIISSQCGVQSHYFFLVSVFRAISIFHSAFRAIITSQSWHSEPSAFSIRRSEPSPLLSFGVQSHHHFSVLAFRAIITSQFWRSGPSSLLSFGVQSHHHFSIKHTEPSAFSIQRSEPSPLLNFGVQSHHHFSVSVFRATISSQSRRSKSSPLLSFGVQSHYFFLVSAFRATISSQSQRSESSPLLSFGIQSHNHFSALAFRATISSQSRRSKSSPLSV